jgi:hypothetical protein
MTQSTATTMSEVQLKRALARLLVKVAKRKAAEAKK